MSEKLESRVMSALEAWMSTCSVPSHPRKCPRCGKKVRIFHLTLKGDAMFKCTDKNGCVWPMQTLKEKDYLGHSNYTLHYKWRKAVRAKRKGILKSDDDDDDEDDDPSSSENENSSENEDSSSSSSSAVLVRECGINHNTEHALDSQEDSVSLKEEHLVETEKVKNPTRRSIFDINPPSPVKADAVSSDCVIPTLSKIEEPAKPVVFGKPIAHSPFRDPAPSPARSGGPNEFSESETEDADMDTIMSFTRAPAMSSPFAHSPFHAPSPFYAPSPGHDLTASDFRRPSSSTRVPGSPWNANHTPIHVPAMLSPLPMTPRHDSTPEHQMSATSERFMSDEMYNINDSEVISKNKKQTLDSPTKSFSSKQSDLKLPPISLKKQTRDSWSIDSSSPSSVATPIPPTDRSLLHAPPTKLDEVVLSLKKTAGNNWNVNESLFEPPKSAPNKNNDEAAKAKRRSGKSMTAPVKKIPSGNASKSCNLQKTIVPLMKSFSSERVESSLKTLPSGKDVESEVNQDNGNNTKSDSVMVKQKVPETLDKEKSSRRDIVQELIEEDPLKDVKQAVKSVPLKTFARKKSKPIFRLKDSESVDEKNISKLKNKLSMTLGVPISISIGGSETDDAKDDDALHQISQLTGKVPDLKENHEFRSLLKSMGKSSDLDNLSFIQKLQQSLLKGEINSNPKVVTFHVGQNKSTIDLPKETLDVTTRKETDVQVLLYSESDGIEGEVLKSTDELPADNSSQFIKKRGGVLKQKKMNPDSTSLTTGNLTTAGPYRFSPTLPQPDLAEHHDQQQQHQQQYVGESEFNFFRDSANLCMFNTLIANLMQGYCFPDQYRDHCIDPVFAMLCYRLYDPTNTPESIAQYQKLMEMYAKYRSAPAMQMQQQQQQSTNLTSNQLNLASNNAESVVASSRTYTELQTVRGLENASDVLREHQSSGIEVEPAKSKSPSPPKTPKITAKPMPKPPQTTSTNIKREVLELANTPGDPSSVMLSSVHPGERSVREVPPNIPASGFIGKGKRVVKINYQNCCIGPIRVETEDEVKALKDLVEDYITKSQSRGKDFSRQTQYFAAAERARSILSEDIVSYLQKAFTKKGMKENTLGRKKRNYPKRSAIIKIDPKTGERINPAATNQIVTIIKKEPDTVDNKTAKQRLVSVPLVVTKDPNPEIQKRVTKMLSIDTRNSSSQMVQREPATDIRSNNNSKVPQRKVLKRTNRVAHETQLTPSMTTSMSKKAKVAELIDSMVEDEVVSENHRMSDPTKRGANDVTTFTRSKTKQLNDRVEHVHSPDTFKLEMPTYSMSSSTTVTSPMISEKIEIAKLTLSNLAKISTVPSSAIKNTANVSPAKSNFVVPSASSPINVKKDTGKKSYEGLFAKSFLDRNEVKVNVEDKMSKNNLAKEILNKMGSDEPGTSFTRTTTTSASPSKNKSMINSMDVPTPMTRNKVKMDEFIKAKGAQLANVKCESDSGGMTRVLKSSDVFVRKTQEKRVEKLIKKQEKKRMALFRKKVYKGLAEKKEGTAENNKKPSKFKPAESIGGVIKKILPNNEVIEVKEESTRDQQPQHPATAGTNHSSDDLQNLLDSLPAVSANQPAPPSPTKRSLKKPAVIKPEERDILDELLNIANDEQNFHHSTFRNQFGMDFDSTPSLDDLF